MVTKVCLSAVLIIRLIIVLLGAGYVVALGEHSDTELKVSAYTAGKFTNP